MAEGPVTYTDKGGGGPLKPHGEDFFERIIGVHWPKKVALTGGVFVAGDGDGNIFYLRIGPDATKDTLGSLTWTQVAHFNDPGPGWGVGFTGSSYGLVDKKPVFVMVGGGGSTHGTGQIYASQDGMSWANVHSIPQNNPDRSTGASAFSVVWDGSAFWAGAHRSWNYLPGIDPNLHEFDILLTSSDGFSWSVAEQHEIVYGGTPGVPPPDYYTGLLDAHISKRVVDSAYGNGVPDGVYKYDEARKLLVRPAEVPSIDYFFGGVSYGHGAGGVEAISESSTAGIIPVNSPPIPVYCVAGVGGAWAAAGGTFASGGSSGSCEAAITVPSTEEGTVSWQVINPPGAIAIMTMVGGAAEAPPP